MSHNRPDNASLKRELSRRFPAVRFTVRSGRGTGCGWTHIGWTDGPTVRRVEQELATLNAAPGTMDQTDYFDGERVSTDRTTSYAFRLRVAALLLAPKPLPPESEWSRGIARGNCGGYYDLWHCIWQATSNREHFERARFDAHAWLDAIRQGLSEAPRSVNYSEA